EAPEALDHLAVADREIEKEARADPLLHELAGPLLVGQVLAVLERQIEEDAPLGRKLEIEAAADRAARHRQGAGVAREGGRRVAEHVARELVEQDDERQRAFGRVGPGLAGAFGGLPPER